jgi:RNA polymerase sigma-70 factor (ECF subfamily)
MNASLHEDRNLLVKCFSGDRKAGEDLVRRFSNLVYQAVQHSFIARHVPHTSEDIEDLHNTVFLHLFEHGCKKLRQYKGKNGCSLATWIRLIAVRTVLDHFRKKEVEVAIRPKMKIPLDEVYGLKQGGKDVLTLLEQAEKERLIREGMEKLPPRDRLFMRLHLDQGLSVPEVAAAMQISLENAHTIKHRAVRKLKAQVALAVGEL